VLSSPPRARFLVSGLGHLDPHIGALEVLEGDTLLLWNFLALVPILRAALLVRHLVAFLRPATLLIWDLFAHFFRSPVSRLAIGRLRLCAVGVVFGLAVLNLLAVVPVFCLTALLRDLLAVIEVDRPALLSWDQFAVFLLLLGRVFFLPSITFLTFLPLYVTVLLHVDLPTFLVWHLVARCR